MLARSPQPQPWNGFRRIGVPAWLSSTSTGPSPTARNTSRPRRWQALRRLEDAGIPVVLGHRKRPPHHLRTCGVFWVSQHPCVVKTGASFGIPRGREPVLRATATEAKEAAQWLAGEIDGLDPNGIATNRWRESEWCLHPDENLEPVTEAMATVPMATPERGPNRFCHPPDGATPQQGRGPEGVV